MQLWYGTRRRPVQLWTFPSIVDGQGRVLRYLAAGPVGVPVRRSQITYVFHRPLPAYSRVELVIEVARDGQLVFGPCRHTSN
jgi:hypothetical protein